MQWSLPWHAYKRIPMFSLFTSHLIISRPSSPMSQGLAKRKLRGQEALRVCVLACVRWRRVAIAKVSPYFFPPLSPNKRGMDVSAEIAIVALAFFAMILALIYRVVL